MKYPLATPPEIIPDPFGVASLRLKTTGLYLWNLKVSNNNFSNFLLLSKGDHSISVVADASLRNSKKSIGWYAKTKNGMGQSQPSGVNDKDD